MAESDAIQMAAVARQPPVTQRELMRHVRARLTESIHDDSTCEAGEFAVYTLSDPRAIREVKYVGQTRAPRQRLWQHINTARLWQPDEVPWWFKSPALRPLYEWIRQLYGDEGRLPFMIIVQWLPTLVEARACERTNIYDLVRAKQSLFNVECARLGQAVPLL